MADLLQFLAKTPVQPRASFYSSGTLTDLDGPAGGTCTVTITLPDGSPGPASGTVSHVSTGVYSFVLDGPPDPIVYDIAWSGQIGGKPVTIDTQAGTVTCPAGSKAPITPSGQASFGKRCQRCPLRQRCTTASGGRTIHVHPHEDELRAARRRATTRGFQDSYRRWRPMVERSIAWLVADGCRRVPYLGIQRNHVWLSVRVAALNLRRLLVLGLTRRDGAWALG